MRYLFETHFHTDESSNCANVPAAEAVAALRSAGYAGAAVTDHYIRWVFEKMKGLSWPEKAERWAKGYYAAKAAAEGTDFVIVCGMEITFTEGPSDYLVYGVDPDFLKEHPELYKLTPRTFFEFANRHGLYFSQAHPFRHPCTPADPRVLHGLEVHNGNPRHNSRNELALQMAEKEGLRQTSGSDYHELEDLGRGGIYLPRLPKDSRDFGRMLLTGEYDGLYRKTDGEN
jgi:hypothetical protein